jgi:hypothetical protein
MRIPRSALLGIAIGLAVGCASRPSPPPESLQKIVVTAEDLAGIPYRVLGTVDYPGAGIALVNLSGRLSGQPTCGPDDTRRTAVKEYGRVDAIIDFAKSGQFAPHCTGMAVVFTAPTPAWPPD